ncbi:MAG TPA: MotA/TolQ/ExbB proton channel family protein [Gemmataceae bacterium]|jgi:biopolymer transport protein ExbB|nr:MotA/TolQ/ExbB proton channel family protein [Gemmataceae bacterium]
MLASVSRRRVLSLAGLLAVFCILALAGPVMAQDAAPADASQKNIFVHIIESAGWIFGPLLILMSIFLIVLVVLLMLDLRMTVAIPPGFVDEFIDTVNKRRFKEAFEMARNDTSFLGRVLTAGMSRLQYGLEDARDAALNMLESIRSGKEQINNYMAVIGSLGPLVGLVGTVLGMIRAFMSLSSGGTPNPAQLSKGIAEALSITFLGIAVSVPAIFFNAFFRNRITKVSMDTGHISDDLLTQMYHNSKKAGATPSGATAGPTGPTPPAPPPGRGATTSPPPM